MKANTYIKTVYEDGQKPNITRYADKDIALAMIAAYAEWGLGIVSCEAIPEEQALAQVRAQTVIYDRA